MVRVIDAEGTSLGVMKLEEALAKAKKAGLDLVLVSAKARPPVTKITEAGKYFYQQHKKFKTRKSEGDVKVVKIRFNTSPHDLEIRLNQIKGFLEKNHQVQLIMFLRGRENALRSQAERKLNDFLETIKAEIPINSQNQSQSKSHQLKINISKQ